MHAVLALGFGLLQTADTANAVDESMRTAGVSQNDRHDDLIALRGIGNTDREGAVVGAHEGSIFEVQGDVQLGAGRADLLVGRNDGLAAADSSADGLAGLRVQHSGGVLQLAVETDDIRERLRLAKLCCEVADVGVYSNNAVLEKALDILSDIAIILQQ